MQVAASNSSRDGMVKIETRIGNAIDKNEKPTNMKNMVMKRKKNPKNMTKIRTETIIIIMRTKRTRKAKAKNTKKIKIENGIDLPQFSLVLA